MVFPLPLLLPGLMGSLFLSDQEACGSEAAPGTTLNLCPEKHEIHLASSTCFPLPPRPSLVLNKEPQQAVPVMLSVYAVLWWAALDSLCWGGSLLRVGTVNRMGRLSLILVLW